MPLQSIEESCELVESSIEADIDIIFFYILIFRFGLARPTFLAGKLEGEPYEGLKTTDIRGMLKAFWYYLKNRGNLK